MLNGESKITVPVLTVVAGVTVLNVAAATAHGSATLTVADGDDPAVLVKTADALTKEKRPEGVTGFNWPESLLYAPLTVIACAAVPSANATTANSLICCDPNNAAGEDVFAPLETCARASADVRLATS